MGVAQAEVDLNDVALPLLDEHDTENAPPAVLERDEKLLPPLDENRLLRRELVDALTPRQRDVLTLCVSGLKPREIADRLGCSATTVRRHLQDIHARLSLTRAS